MADAPAPSDHSSDGSTPWILTGGIVAFNEERNVREAIRSLLDQDLPPGVRWGTVWVVASGCTDRTVEEAEREAEQDTRVRVVVEVERRGKARAISEVLSRARGDAVVLLNADARALPGAVAALCRTAAGQRAPFAVMAHPIVPSSDATSLSRALRLSWALHHALHMEFARRGGATQLSDELLLLSTAGIPPLPEGVINDGAFLGAWLTRNGGGRFYAPEALASIETPVTLRDHLTQRRRIHFGNRQVVEMVGVVPDTLPRYALRRPTDALRLVRATLREEGLRWRDLMLLGIAELGSVALSIWDRMPPQKDHVRWTRIRQPMPWPRNTGP